MKRWNEETVQFWLSTFCVANRIPYNQPKMRPNGKALVEWQGKVQSGDKMLENYLKQIVGTALVREAISALAAMQELSPADDAASSSSSSDDCARMKSNEASLAEEFMTEYIDKSNIIPSFTNYVTSCHNSFKSGRDTFLSPYVTLVQSSGYGKTRLLRELATKLPTLYVCLRDKKSTGYPPRTNTAITALFEGLNVKERQGYVTELKRRLHHFVQNALRLKSRLLAIDEMDQDPQVKALFPSERYPHVWAYPKDSNQPKPWREKAEVVVLAFDEARECLEIIREIGVSQFRLIRQALREFATDPSTKHLKLIGIFVDTSSRIQNFAPTMDNDPSARAVTRGNEIDYRELKLFHPYILCGTCDLHFEISSQDISSLRTSQKYLLVGRPLVTQSSRSNLEHQDFLKRKLFGGGCSLTGQAALGLMLCRVSAFICPRHSVASDLVANHVATLLACDEERKGMLSTYIAEPRLAIAAADVWEDESIFSNQCIPALQRALMSGALSQGIRGEIVAQILLLLACDSACKDAGKEPGSCVNLSAVLTQLLPVGTEDNLLEKVIPRSLQDAQIACCQFLHVAYQFTNSTFFELAERHCGASLREGQRGADLVIPIIGEVPGYLIIQVKNLISCQKDCAESNMVCRCLMPSYVFALDRMDNEYLQGLDRASVRLFMQLGAHTPSAMAVHRPKGGFPSALEIFGTEARCLSSRRNRAAAVKMLVRGKVDLAGFIDGVNIAGPIPDVGGLRARNAWPFLIATHQSDRLEGSPSQV
jgi:hypothetical protein